jgi:hypothetical protein
MNGVASSRHRLINLACLLQLLKKHAQEVLPALPSQVRRHDDRGRKAGSGH